jgi:hypothetical protein
MEMGKIANVVVKPSGVRITWEKRQNVNAVPSIWTESSFPPNISTMPRGKKSREREGIEFTPALAAKFGGFRAWKLWMSSSRRGEKIFAIGKEQYGRFQKRGLHQFFGDSVRKRHPSQRCGDLGLSEIQKDQNRDHLRIEKCDESLGKNQIAECIRCHRRWQRSHFGQPNPEVFLRAANKLGIPPENCVVVDDSLSGIQAAKAAGMFSASPSEAKESPLCDWSSKTCPN